ncbi:MAG: hypothetical protein DMF58_17730 [Acidobacteria bacterium]|nr:MAG: hypothetical protein DMF58_17730 [Acidobacteriota bacterium]
MTELAKPTLEAIRVRVTQVLPAQVRTALEKLGEEQIWWRPNEKSNSVGNLVLHLSGSLNLYLNRNIGGFDYKRDRDAEFAERGPIPKEKLLKIFDDMVAEAEQTLSKLSADRLAGPSSDPERNTFLIEDLVSILTHISTHTGQILWITKMLNEGALDEVWMRTHKRLGGWRQR